MKRMVLILMLCGCSAAPVDLEIESTQALDLIVDAGPEATSEPQPEAAPPMKRIANRGVTWDKADGG